MSRTRKYKVAVLGCGNGGLTYAGDLALGGHEVNLYELPQFKENLDPIVDAGGIEMTGVCRNGFAKLNMVSSNMEDVLKGVEVILVVVPAYGHASFAEVMAPYLQEGQIVVLSPGYSFGLVEVVNVLKGRGVDVNKISLGATNAIPYATRKYLGNKVFCHRLKAKVPFTAFPAKNTGKMLITLNQLYPQDDGERGILIPTDNELKTTLENINLFAHPPMMILKAVDIELGEDPREKSDDSYVVQCLARAINKETMEITKAFGLEPWSREYLKGVLMYPYWLKTPRKGDRPEWAKRENLSKEYVAGANLLHMRYLTEDIPYGLVPISELARKVGVPTPVIDSVITIASVIIRTDFRTTGRTLQKLGIAHMGKDELLRYLNEGES